MNVFESLHRLILGPIELLLDVIFALTTRFFHNPGFSIVVLSLIINILVLPLYRKADQMQKQEQETALRLKPRADRIKAAFSGDERFMILQTFYRQNHYKPWYVLRSSVSLLLQIPFFMAAYNFLSHLQAIQGVSYGPIQDLGLPDRMLQIGGLAINLLPILMTTINLVSGAIYTRGLSLRNKVQLYGMAMLFLVLLYDSPAGLVLYWTMNNVFSLGKNAVEKCKNPRKAAAFLSSAAGLAVALRVLSRFREMEMKSAAVAIGMSVILQLPLLTFLFQNRHQGRIKAPVIEKNRNQSLFLICATTLTILTGLLIPSAVVNSSPAEFIDAGQFQNPLIYVWNSFLLAAGLFLVWFFIYYKMLSSEWKRSAFTFVMGILSTVFLVDFLFFGNEYGDMSSLMQYGMDLPATAQQKIINLGVLVVLISLMVWLWKRKRGLIRALCIVECMAIAGASALNVISISRQLPAIEKAFGSSEKKQKDDIIHLDRHGKNVVVIMLDRAIGGLVPFLFEEKTELKEQFAGFVWYPNTLSYGYSTNTGSPALFGGYDYVPEKIDQRREVSLREKQNEALKIMPYNFRNAGYEVTVCDPPYANYQWTPDLSIYADDPEIRTWNTEGLFGAEDQETIERYRKVRNRNIFCYSILRCAPVVIQPTLYENGNYNDSDLSSGVVQRALSLSKAQGESGEFARCYRVLENLPRMTAVFENGENRFLMIDNNTTHVPVLLQEPEYRMSMQINNSIYDAEHAVRYSMDGREMVLGDLNQMEHYHINMAAYLKIGEWLDWLKEQGVYDNTRIIIVADHGWTFGYPGREETAAAFAQSGLNPVLLVKDFYSRDAFRMDEQFMTNGDTPYLAFQGLIDNPWNPYLKRAITDEGKWNSEQKICITDWHVNGDDTSFNGSYVIVNPQSWRCR